MGRRRRKVEKVTRPRKIVEWRGILNLKRLDSLSFSFIFDEIYQDGVGIRPAYISSRRPWKAETFAQLLLSSRYAVVIQEIEKRRKRGWSRCRWLSLTTAPPTYLIRNSILWTKKMPRPFFFWCRKWDEKKGCGLWKVVSMTTGVPPPISIWFIHSLLYYKNSPPL